MKIEDFPLVIYNDGQVFFNQDLQEHDGYFIAENTKWTVLSANPVCQEEKKTSQKSTLNKLSLLGGVLSGITGKFLFVEKSEQGADLFAEGTHIVVKNNLEDKEVEFMYDKNDNALMVGVLQRGQELVGKKYTKEQFKDTGFEDVKEMVWAVVDTGDLTPEEKRLSKSEIIKPEITSAVLRQQGKGL